VGGRGGGGRVGGGGEVRWGEGVEGRGVEGGGEKRVGSAITVGVSAGLNAEKEKKSKRKLHSIWKRELCFLDRRRGGLGKKRGGRRRSDKNATGEYCEARLEQNKKKKKKPDKKKKKEPHPSNKKIPAKEGRGCLVAHR